MTILYARPTAYGLTALSRLLDRHGIPHSPGPYRHTLTTPEPPADVPPAVRRSRDLAALDTP